MNIRLIACLALCCSAMPALAAKPRMPATPIDTSAPVEIILTQQELAVDVPDTANAVGMQFGLIGALVGTAVSNAQVKNGEERVRGLRDLLLDYPFNARMEEALRRKLHAEGVLAGQDVRTLQASWDGDSATMPTPVEDALVLVPGYAVLSNFEQLTVKLALTHAERTARPGKKPKQKILFSRQYAYHFPLAPLDGHGPEENASRWESFGPDSLQSLLDTGIDQVTDMLVYDLSTEGRAEADLPIRGMSTTIAGHDFNGRAVRETERWVWLRAGPGALRTLVGQHPVDEGILAPASMVADPGAPVPHAHDDAASGGGHDAGHGLEDRSGIGAGDREATSEPAPAPPPEPTVQEPAPASSTGE